MELSNKRELQLLEINRRLIETNNELKEIINRATRMTYAIKYEKRYYANKDCFEQYITLTQGKLSVEEYAYEFERLHYLCELGDALDFNHFLSGLRPSILKNVEKECNDMYEAFWEAIRVERMFKMSHQMEVASHEPKSPHLTDCVEELMPADMQTDQPEFHKETSISTVGFEISHMSTNNFEVQIPSDEAKVIGIPHIHSPIDFVFRDQLCQLGDDQLIVRAFDLMMHVLQVRHISTYFSHQKQLCMKLCQEVIDRLTNRKFVRLIFDPGGHFPNSRSSSFSSGGE